MVLTDSAPFVVITLRRTGGTSLMTFMSGISEYETIQHEPFNVERVWGPIVSAFNENRNEEELATLVRSAIASKPNIKHCFEIIPLEVTRALIDGCRDLGYKFFVLTRRNEVDRLMSLMLARATGVWGGDGVKTVYPKILSGEVRVPPLSVDDALKQARRDSYYLGETLKLLRHRQVDYDWLLFEEIYKGEVPIEFHARIIAKKLGSDVDEGDPRLLKLAEKSAQNSGRIEEKVENSSAVRQRLEKICLS